MEASVQQVKWSRGIRNDTLPYFLKRCPISLEMEGGPWLAGGSILRWWNEEPEADYDIFFYDGAQLNKAQEDLFNSNYYQVSASDYADTWENDEGNIIQVCYERWYDTPQEVIDSFDFVLCMWLCGSNRILTSSETIHDSKLKFINIENIRYPGRILERLFKYSQRGYKFHNAEFYRIARKIRDNPDMKF